MAAPKKTTIREEWENMVGIKRKTKKSPMRATLDDYVYVTPFITLPDPQPQPITLPAIDFGSDEHVYYWAEGHYTPRSREVVGATLFIEATLHPQGKTVAQITAWQQPHGEQRRRLGYNWRRVPPGRWCVDFEAPGWGPGTVLVAHKERNFVDPARAFAWIALLVGMTERMTMRDWTELRRQHAWNELRVPGWNDCPLT